MRFGRRRGLGRRWRTPRISVLCAAVAAILLCVWVLKVVWTIFQHAYVGSYWFVPGARVDQVYWSSVHFAFAATFAVTALGGALVGLAVLELSRLRR